MEATANTFDSHWPTESASVCRYTISIPDAINVETVDQNMQKRMCSAVGYWGLYCGSTVVCSTRHKNTQCHSQGEASTLINTK